MLKENVFGFLAHGEQCVIVCSTVTLYKYHPPRSCIVHYNAYNKEKREDLTLSYDKHPQTTGNVKYNTKTFKCNISITQRLQTDLRRSGVAKQTSNRYGKSRFKGPTFQLPVTIVKSKRQT